MLSSHSFCLLIPSAQIEDATTESESLVDLTSDYTTSADYTPVCAFFSINTPTTRPSSACPTTGVRKPKAKRSF